MRFGQKMRLVRMASEMLQAGLQDTTGIPANYLSHIETGKLEPTAEWEQRIREALHWTPRVDELLDELAAELAREEQVA